MGVIRLKNMLFYGYHGRSESEKNLGGKFEVDLDLFLPLQQAGQSDHLEDTVDYEAIYQTVDKCIQGRKFYLIEALAENIARAIVTRYPVQRIQIRVRKPHAPVKGVLDTVEVELERTRADYDDNNRSDEDL